MHRERSLTALPVFNEVAHVCDVLREVRRYSQDVLVVDDGSTDGTSERLAELAGIQVVRHPNNLGYGAALKTAFDYGLQQGYDVLVTIDCDGQHQPRRIPEFVAACDDEIDIVSGSRYLQQFEGDSLPPAERRRVNETITAEVNRRLGLHLTDAFCGFKAYRVSGLAKLDLTEAGYGMPLELWVQAAFAGLRIAELPVPLIYLDEKRSFGGALDDTERRLAYYRDLLDRTIAVAEARRPAAQGQQPRESRRALCGDAAE